MVDTLIQSELVGPTGSGKMAEETPPEKIQMTGSASP
jgi:hypothetical protein